MKFTEENAKRLAKEFITTWQADAWRFVESDVRRALLDNYVLDAIRLSTEYDENGKPTGFNDSTQVTRTEAQTALLHFIGQVREILRTGVRAGSRSHVRHYEI